MGEEREIRTTFIIIRRLCEAAFFRVTSAKLAANIKDAGTNEVGLFDSSALLPSWLQTGGSAAEHQSVSSSRTHQPNDPSASTSGCAVQVDVNKAKSRSFSRHRRLVFEINLKAAAPK